MLGLELVPKENILDIGKYNGRIPRRLTPREPTFQVVLDVIALTLCYPASLITVDVPEVYMHQDIFWICPRVPGRDFDPLPFEEDTVSFLRELGHTGEINSLNDVVVDQMHQPRRTFSALINLGLSGKTSGLDKLRLSKAQILWESTQIYGAILPECLTSPVMKESKAYKTYLGYATDLPRNLQLLQQQVSSSERPPVETKSKRKEKEKVDVAHGKGIELLFDVALTEEAQMKEVINQVPDMTKRLPTESESDSLGNDEDDTTMEQGSSNESSEINNITTRNISSL
ncbi:hypothetical protein Tco_0516253 [Tanacetum coccineum]